MTNHAPETAFADPATLRAWQRDRRRSLTALILWTMCLPACVVLFAFAVDWIKEPIAITIAVPVIFVTAVGIGVASLRWERIGQMRAVLTTYPWQDSPPLGAGHPAGIEYFHLPNPDEPHKKIKVAFRRYGMASKWQRAVAEARSAGFAFAGDPRFACVVALPGHRKLLAVRPQHLHLNSDGTRPDRVSEAAWRRAQEAGITTPPSIEEQRRKLLYSLWRIFRKRPSAR
ncbi:hypothetical protein OHB14_30125 [Streptomyces sp. NBC_01613]|uniref:hypothetical protein n=1 Tax=Streptomyces sp. NBC_01613 TaxID=2975896 RepID=UPI003864366C